MRYHRRKCQVWKNRPSPKELTKARRATHRRAAPEATKCPQCQARPGRHKTGCKFSVEERRRQALLDRHGIDSEFWELFLKALTAAYEG